MRTDALVLEADRYIYIYDWSTCSFTLSLDLEVLPHDPCHMAGTLLQGN